MSCQLLNSLSYCHLHKIRQETHLR